MSQVNKFFLPYFSTKKRFCSNNLKIKNIITMTNKLVRNLASLIIRFKVWVLILVIVLTAFFGYYATKVQIEPDIMKSLPQSDTLVKLYDYVGDKYGGNNSCIVILETKNVFTPQVLKDVRAVTDTLQNLEGISSVTSLTNIMDIKSSDWGIEIGKLVDEYDLPTTEKQLDSLKQRVFSDDMYRGVIVSKDGSATAIIAQIASDNQRLEIAKKIKQKIKQMHLKEKVYFAGMPFMMNDTSDLILRDLARLIPIVTLIIVLILYLGFRSLRGVLLPLLTVGISAVWTIGLISLTGNKLDIISDIIPVILLALGTAYAIHVLNRINEQVKDTSEEELVEALAGIISPVFMAYLTTAFGFISFIFKSYLSSIKLFGLFSAIGITFAFILAVAFIPAMIATFHFKRASQYKSDTKLVQSVLQPLAGKIYDRPWLTVGIWIGIAVIFAFGIPRIERKVDMVSYFKKGSPIRQAQEIVDKKFSGVSQITVLFKGDVQDPKFLMTMDSVANYMQSISPYVKNVMSVSDLIKRMNDAMGEGKKIPNDRAKIEQLWFLLDGQEVMDRLVDPDLNEAVIQAQFASLDTKASNEFAKKIEQYVKQHSTKDIQISVTGLPSIYRKLDYSIIISQYSSLVLAIILMIAIISLIMWSFQSGLLAMVPLFLTLITSYGLMGFVHIPLSVSTVLIASVTMGVGVDYSIHIISHYREYLNKFGDTRKAIVETIRVSGNAIVLNVLSVALGFFALIFSALVPIKDFGVMMGFSMIVSGFSAITLLPALIVILNKNKTQKM